MTTSQEAGDRWVEEQLASARPVFARTHQPGTLSFASIEEYEATLRRQVEAFLAPVDHLVGLELPQAHQRARERGDHVCEHPAQGHRDYLSPRRVHVLVDGRVVTAAFRDYPQWRRAVEAEPDW